MKNSELSGEYWRGSWALSFLTWPQRICACKWTHKVTWPWSKAKLHLCNHILCTNAFLQAHAYTFKYMQACTHMHRCNSNTWFTCMKRSEEEDFSPCFFCLSLSFPCSISTFPPVSFSFFLLSFQPPLCPSLRLLPPFSSAVLPLIYAFSSVPA